MAFDFTDAKDGFVFDQMNPGKPYFHGISRLHRVDFIVEMEEVYIFVEVKDPANPKARSKDVAHFLAEVIDGTLRDTLAAKFMESFIYRWAEDQLNKPVHYISLVTIEDPALLSTLQDDLTQKLPPIGIPPTSRWVRPFLLSCQIFDLSAWNEQFPQWPVQRISTSIIFPSW